MSVADSTVAYRDVPDFPGYRVGDDGSVWSRWKKVYGGWVVGSLWRRKTPSTAQLGYKYVRLFPGRKFRFVHRLVLEAFGGPCPKGLVCRHFPDRNPANNKLCNLRWGTNQENHEDQVCHGTDCRGVRNPAAKLTEDKVQAIRDEYTRGGITQIHLGRKYHLSQPQVSVIILRKRKGGWAHVV